MRTPHIKTYGMWTKKYLKENVYPLINVLENKINCYKNVSIQLKKHKNKINVKKLEGRN